MKKNCLDLLSEPILIYKEKQLPHGENNYLRCSSGSDNLVRCNRVPRQRSTVRRTNAPQRPTSIWGNEDPNLPLLRMAFRNQNLGSFPRNSKSSVPVVRTIPQPSRRQEPPVQNFQGSKLSTPVQPVQMPRPSCRSLSNADQQLLPSPSNNSLKFRKNTYEVSDPNLLINMQMINQSNVCNVFDQSPPHAYDNMLSDTLAEPNGEEFVQRYMHDMPEPNVQQYNRRTNSTGNDVTNGSQFDSISMNGTIRLFDVNSDDSQQQQQQQQPHQKNQLKQQQQQSSPPRHQSRQSNDVSGSAKLDEYLDNCMDVNMMASREYAVLGRPYVRIDETRDVVTPDIWYEITDNRSSLGSQPRYSQGSIYMDDGQTECYPSHDSSEWLDCKTSTNDLAIARESCGTFGIRSSFGGSQFSPYEPRQVVQSNLRRTRATSVDRDYLPSRRTCRRNNFDRNTN